MLFIQIFAIVLSLLGMTQLTNKQVIVCGYGVEIVLVSVFVSFYLKYVKSKKSLILSLLFSSEIFNFLVLKKE